MIGWNVLKGNPPVNNRSPVQIRPAWSTYFAGRSPARIRISSVGGAGDVSVKAVGATAPATAAGVDLEERKYRNAIKEPMIRMATPAPTQRARSGTKLLRCVGFGIINPSLGVSSSCSDCAIWAGFAGSERGPKSGAY